ncbi:MAG: hypothetical protein IK025_04460 [Bacteroidales bacterium]|nr:hypothetical protein [Bacteroidales bacterium]
MNSKLEILKVVLLAIIAGCLIILVIKRFDEKEQRVYVSGGNVNAEVTGSVDVDNTVDINIEEINGHSDVFYNNYSRGDKDKYYRIPVITQ